MNMTIAQMNMTFSQMNMTIAEMNTCRVCTPGRIVQVFTWMNMTFSGTPGQVFTWVNMTFSGPVAHLFVWVNMTFSRRVSGGRRIAHGDRVEVAAVRGALVDDVQLAEVGQPLDGATHGHNRHGGAFGDAGMRGPRSVIGPREARDGGEHVAVTTAGARVLVHPMQGRRHYSSPPGRRQAPPPPLRFDMSARPGRSCDTTRAVGAWVVVVVGLVDAALHQPAHFLGDGPGLAGADALKGGGEFQRNADSDVD